MIDIERQIHYWREGSDGSLELALHLVERGNILEGLFFAHLALEKMLKAHICKSSGGLAPRLHALVRLSERTKLLLSKEKRETLAVMSRFCIEGRYPNSLTDSPSRGEAEVYLSRTEELLKWLKRRL